MGSGRSPIGVSIYQGCSVSPDTSNYRTPMAHWADRRRKMGPGCLEISVTSGVPTPEDSGVSRSVWAFSRAVLFHLIHRIIGCQWRNGDDLKRELEKGCLEISVRSGGSMPVGFGRFHICVSVYQAGSFPPVTSIYRIQVAERGRSKKGAGAGASGNISYVRRRQESGFRAFPYRCRHFRWMFCFV